MLGVEELEALEGRCDIIEGKIKDHLRQIDASTVVYVSQVTRGGGGGAGGEGKECWFRMGWHT